MMIKKFERHRMKDKATHDYKFYKGYSHQIDLKDIK